MASCKPQWDVALCLKHMGFCYLYGTLYLNTIFEVLLPYSLAPSSRFFDSLGLDMIELHILRYAL